MTFSGIQIVPKKGMLRGAWMLRDAKDNILVCGVIGHGQVVTPGVDTRHGVKMECHPDLYEELRKATHGPSRS